MQACFQGLIGRVEIPDLFTFVHLARRTGLAELSRPDQVTRIYVQQGDPIFASSEKEGLRIGDLLLRTGKIKPKDRDRCLARQRIGGPPLGQLLVDEGLLSDTELQSLLKVQVSEVIFNTFAWTQGTFSFYDDLAPPPGSVTLRMDIQNLLMEGVRRMDERGRLKEVFPDHDAIVQLLGNRDSLKDTLTLTPEEWRILFLIDGRRTLREVCELAGNADELASLEILNRLLSGNLIGLVPARRTERSILEALATEAIAGRKKTVPEVQARPPVESDETSDAKVVVSSEAVLYSSQTVALWARLILHRNGQATSFPLALEAQTLGRSLKNDIVISDPVVSTFHARVDRARDGFSIVDLKSTNGTFVNGARITSVVLRPKDEIQVGEVKLVYAED